MSEVAPVVQDLSTRLDSLLQPHPQPAEHATEPQADSTLAQDGLVHALLSVDPKEHVHLRLQVESSSGAASASPVASEHIQSASAPSKSEGHALKAESAQGTCLAISCCIVVPESALPLSQLFETHRLCPCLTHGACCAVFAMPATILNAIKYAQHFLKCGMVSNTNSTIQNPTLDWISHQYYLASALQTYLMPCRAFGCAAHLCGDPQDATGGCSS